MFLNYLNVLFFFFDFYNLIIIIPDNNVKSIFLNSEYITKKTANMLTTAIFCKKIATIFDVKLSVVLSNLISNDYQFLK